MKTKILLITDPGIDDAMALILAHAVPELDVVAVATSAGNVGAKTTFENAWRLIKLLRLSPAPPVGMSDLPSPESARARHIHGENGLGNVEIPLPRMTPAIPSRELIIDAIEEHAGEIEIVALSPLTDLAAVLAKRPDIVPNVRRIIVMGGAVERCGNVTATAEFNVWADPAAADAVFSAGFEELVLIPLDVTTACPFFPEDIAPIRHAGGPVGDFVAGIMDYSFSAREALYGEELSNLHDSLAVAVAYDESFVDFRRAYVRVETKGEYTRGMTIALRPGPEETHNLSYAHAVDAPRFKKFLVESIAELTHRGR